MDVCAALILTYCKRMLKPYLHNDNESYLQEMSNIEYENAACQYPRDHTFKKLKLI